MDLQKLQIAHISGTYAWLLQNQTYLEWRDIPLASPHKNVFLWIQGKPGSGKSVLASQVVQDLQFLRGSIVLYIFCKAGEDNKDALIPLLRNLVFQLLCLSLTQQKYHQLILNARLGAKTPFLRSMEALWTILAQMLKENINVDYVLDGLDECQYSNVELTLFLARFVEVLMRSPSRARTVIISRLDRAEAGDSEFLWKSVQIQSSDVRDDIELLTSTRMETSRVLMMHPKMPQLLKKVVDSSDGMILWAELMLTELEAGH